jgi:hypothetical protein
MVLEVPKSPWIQGFRSDCPSESSNTIYWLETLFFGGTKFASPLAPISKGDGSSIIPSLSKEEEGQGAAAPHGLSPSRTVADAGCRRRRMWAPSPPTLPGEAPLHHHLQHLLIIPTVISWQTWCVVQSIIFLWSIISISKFEYWLFLAIVKYFTDWLHTSLLSFMMVLCTDIWVQTYIGGCIILSPLHVVRRRDGRSWTETVFQVLYACFINSWLINGNILWTFELKAVVGHTCLNESLVSSFTWPRDQSLGCVVVHSLDYIPIYGST